MGVFCLQILQNPRRETLIDDVVGKLAYDSGATLREEIISRAVRVRIANTAAVRWGKVNRSDIKASTTSSLIHAYRAAAAAHGVATDGGDYRKANRNHDLVAAIYRELRSRGDEARVELLVLLDDVDPHVRGWAAAHALEFAPDRGERVLRRLAGSGGEVGLSAEMTLREWANGSLTFP
jgi:hypothetical protein